MTRTRTAIFILMLPLLAVVTGCSTSRNTAASRSYSTQHCRTSGTCTGIVLTYTTGSHITLLMAV